MQLRKAAVVQLYLSFFHGLNLRSAVVIKPNKIDRYLTDSVKYENFSIAKEIKI